MPNLRCFEAIPLAEYRLLGLSANNSLFNIPKVECIKWLREPKSHMGTAQRDCSDVGHFSRAAHELNSMLVYIAERFILCQRQI